MQAVGLTFIVLSAEPVQNHSLPGSIGGAAPFVSGFAAGFAGSIESAASCRAVPVGVFVLDIGFS